MIVVIDLGIGNIGSIVNMLRKNGCGAVVSSSAQEIERAGKLILPGVGAFDNAMKALDEKGLIPVLNKAVLEDKKIVLGICLGMQLFASKSEEGMLPGLGWLDGEVIRFRSADSLKIPHMGWNTIEVVKRSPLLSDMFAEPRFYFVHSYHFVCNDQRDVLAKTGYGYDFVSAVQKDNIMGVQFHPEKSHKFGLKLFNNFVKLQNA